MSLELTVSAPAKLFVAGEYAVTRGGSAVVAAVSRRVTCRVSARPGSGRITVGHRSRTWSFGDDPGSAESAPVELRFAAFAAWLAARACGHRALDLDFETAGDLDEPGAEKTGLGGSAAATVAVVAASFAAAGRDPAGERTLAERIATAVLAHRAAQGGGSAADVVASSCGGLSVVSGLERLPSPRSLAEAADALRQALGATVSVERLDLPRGLSFEAVATGRAARTGPRASRFSRGFDGPGRGVLEAWTEGMEHATRELVLALRSGVEEPVRRAFAASGRWLERLAPLLSMPILSARLRLACEVARGASAVARVSGAGGGDCAIALVGDDRAMALRSAWREAGLAPLAVAIDGGPRVEPPATPGGRRG